MTALRAILVDDEPLARRGLELRLRALGGVELLAQCGNGDEALSALREHEPDLMFLDIQMPGRDGFQTLEAIPTSLMPMVVFVTAFDHHAIRAFEAAALDYLLKPIDEARLAEALARARRQLEEREAEEHRSRLLRLLGEVSGRPGLTLEQALAGEAGELAPRADERIAIRDGQRLVRVDPASIRWVDAAGDYMCIHTDAETFVLRATMRQIEGMLDAGRFQRIHRSSIVNVERVRELRAHINGEYFLKLDCGHELKLSRSYRDKASIFGA